LEKTMMKLSFTSVAVASAFALSCSSSEDAGGGGSAPGGVLAQNQGQTLAVASDGLHVYWASKMTGKIMKAGVNGGTPIELAGNQKWPSTGLAVDATHVYWNTVSTDGTLMKVSSSGGQPESLIGSGVNGIRSIAVDANAVYYTNNTGGTIGRYDLAANSPSVLVSGLTGPMMIAIDADNVYWTELQGRVKKVPKAGGASTQLAEGAAGGAIAVTTGGVYWLAGEAVMKVALQGGTAVELAKGQYVKGVAADEQFVYFTDYLAGTVNKVSVDGGEVTTLAANQQGPEPIAIDGTSVYWANGGDSTVRKAAK